jgi:hypothetical protein
MQSLPCTLIPPLLPNTRSTPFALDCSALLLAVRWLQLKMLRSFAQSPARQTAYFSRRVLSTTRNTRAVAAAAPRLTTSTPLFSSSSLAKRAVTSTNQNLTSRALSSDSDQKNKKKSADKDGSDTKEIVLTPGEQVAAASRITMWVGVSIFAGFCAYFIGKELIPT